MQFLSIFHNSFLNPITLLCIVVSLFLLQVFTQYSSYGKTGKFFHNYPANTFLFFAPIYEEVLFRGIIFSGLLTVYSVGISVLISSALFGVWHIRSIYFMSKRKTLAQMFYAGIIIGPIFAYLTFLTGDIWLAVILHYINNILAPLIQEKNKVEL